MVLGAGKGRAASPSALPPALLGKSRPRGRGASGGRARRPLSQLPARSGLQSASREQVGRMGSSSRFPVGVTAVGLLKHGRQKVAWPRIGPWGPWEAWAFMPLLLLISILAPNHIIDYFDIWMAS